MPVWLTIVLALGGSTLITLIVTFIFNSITNSAKKRTERAKEIADEVAKRDENVRKGVQALLRNALYTLYDDCTNKHYATINEKNNFENLYIHYHNLGKNGVMDNLKDEFMALPSTKATTTKQNKNKKQLVG